VALAESGFEVGWAVEAAYRLLVEGVEAFDAKLSRLAALLVKNNIAYSLGLRLKPQLNVYRIILSIWHARNAKPHPREVLEEAAHHTSNLQQSRDGEA